MHDPLILFVVFQIGVVKRILAGLIIKLPKLVSAAKRQPDKPKIQAFIFRYSLIMDKESLSNSATIQPR